MLPDMLRPVFTHTPFALGKLTNLMFPKLVELKSNLIGAAFSVMKLLPARAILEDALHTGQLEPGTEVFESTSGTFGLALAMLQPEYGYKLTLVSDPVIDDHLAARFQELGVRVEIVKHKVAGGYQLARLERLQELMTASPKAFFTNQYHNPANSRGYAPLAPYFRDHLGEVDILVGTVGTGGSMCGTGKAVRALMPNVKIVGVDTHRSVVFGQPNGERHLRGLGNSLVPCNVEHTMFDEIHWIGAADAYRATRRLHAHHGLYMGGTSGASYQVAEWLAQRYPDKKVLCLLPDEGYRYQHTIYNDLWLETVPLWHDATTTNPVQVHAADVETEKWCWMDWGRRALA